MASEDVFYFKPFLVRFPISVGGFRTWQPRHMQKQVACIWICRVVEVKDGVGKRRRADGFRLCLPPSGYALPNGGDACHWTRPPRTKQREKKVRYCPTTLRSVAEAHHWKGPLV